MKYQVNDSFFNVRKNGDHDIVKVGTYLSSKQYAALSPAKKAKCAAAPRAGFWTDEQLGFLIDLYLEYADVSNGDITQVVELFLELFPERSQGSANARAWSILGLDSKCPKVGLGTYSQDLVDRLHQIDPERFPVTAADEARVAGKLDALLAGLRG